MRKIKIAQIGTSDFSHGNDIFNTLKKMDDVFEIVGYHFPENEREKFPNRMADFEGYKELSLEEILNNPEIEAVTVETEEIYLTKYAIMAAEHNKHIHMEKPGGTEPSDFENLIKTVKSNGKVFHTGYMYRYNPYILDLIAKVKSGELGEIISVEAQMNCNEPKNLRKWLESFPGGMMFFLGCHLVDLVLQINGLPERVVPFNMCTGVEGVTSTDYGMAVFEYKNGVSFVKTNACEIGGFLRRQLVVTGTKGTVELKPLEVFDENGRHTDKTEYFNIEWHKSGITSRSDSCDRYKGMMNAFAEYVRGEKQNPYTLDYELTLYKILLKACGK